MSRGARERPHKLWQQNLSLQKSLTVRVRSRTTPAAGLASALLVADDADDADENEDEDENEGRGH
jgi:hypothetical protein